MTATALTEVQWLLPFPPAVAVAVAVSIIKKPGPRAHASYVWAIAA